MCSLTTAKQLYVGCRDGTLFEISLENNSFELKREIHTDYTISTIAAVKEDLFIIGQNSGSGWADNRGQVSLIKLVDTDSKNV